MKSDRGRVRERENEKDDELGLETESKHAHQRRPAAMTSTRSEIAIHRSVIPSSALFSARHPPRCRTLSSTSSSRRKRGALAPCALPDAALFADVALATQSAVASYPPVASFETAVYAVSCYLDTMVQQSLAGKKRRGIKRGRRGTVSPRSKLERARLSADDPHPPSWKTGGKNSNSKNIFSSQARPRPPLRSSAPQASRLPCRPALSPCSL